MTLPPTSSLPHPHPLPPATPLALPPFCHPP
ncbi:hypothetical protein E2C01_089057 [Portunus trituberculatus]|uniref:Uncharacterized protein n=1 Tax=Portunus trituberculatus TaxID=210409 RepID=A0A5B7JAY9_PORTR|nr:hypothetical protein [Portunus trituberculatus]